MTNCDKMFDKLDHEKVKMLDKIRDILECRKDKDRKNCYRTLELLNAHFRSMSFTAMHNNSLISEAIGTIFRNEDYDLRDVYSGVLEATEKFLVKMKEYTLCFERFEAQIKEDIKSLG